MTDEKELPKEPIEEAMQQEDVSQDTPAAEDPINELRTVNQHYAEEIAELKANLEMVRSRQPREEAKQPNDFGDLTDEDFPTVGQMKNALETREKQYRESIEEMQVAAKYPDYQEVISSYLPKLLKEKPHLHGSIATAPNKALAAYELAALFKQARAEGTPVKKSADEAARIVKNAQKPASISQAGGSSSISSADYYSGLSDSEFFKLVQQNMGNN